MRLDHSMVDLIQPPANYLIKRVSLPSGYPGIGLLSIRSFLEANEIRTTLYNIGSDSIDRSERLKILNKIASSRSKYVCISMNWIQLSIGCLQTAYHIKNMNKEKIIIIGGHHASFWAAEIRERYQDIIDFIIIGEAEMPLLSIIKERREVDRCEIVWAERGSEIEMEELPFYNYDSIIPSEKHKLRALSTTRGLCTKKCNYCLEARGNLPYYSRKLSLHTTEWLTGQIGAFYEKDISLTIQDQFFIFGDPPLIELTKKIRKMGYFFDEFNIFIEPGSYNPSTFNYLSKMPATIVSVDIGCETNINSSLKRMNRCYNEQTILKDLRAMTSHRIIPYTWWMFNLPGEKKGNIKEKLHFIVETMSLGAIPRWITPLILFPNLNLMQKEKRRVKYFFNNFEDLCRFSEVPYNADGYYPSLTTHLFTDSDMDIDEIYHIIKQTKEKIVENWHRLERFYLRAGYSKNFIKRLWNMYGLTNSNSFDRSTFF